MNTFFGAYPELKEPWLPMGCPITDVWRLNRGGHDSSQNLRRPITPQAGAHDGQPTVVFWPKP